MATAQKLTLAQDASEGPSAEALADFVVIRTEDIEADAGNRLRAVDSARALAIGMGMARDGQDTPIVVTRLPGSQRWTLVVGGHRLDGARQVGIAQLKAEIVGPNRDSRQLREARENLFRTDLTPIDRAKHIATMVRIKRAQAGLQVTEGRDRMVSTPLMRAINVEQGETLDTMSRVYGWTDEVGAELGFSSRTVRRDLLLYRGIGEAIVERLQAARHPDLTNATQLRALAKLGAGSQKRVVELLLAPGASLNYGQPKTIAEAIRHPLGPKPAQQVSPETKRHSTFTSTFGRMGVAERKGALASIIKQLPAGITIVEQGGAMAPAGGAVISQANAAALLSGLSVADFYLGIMQPADDSPTHANWADNRKIVDRAKRTLDAALRPA